MQLMQPKQFVLQPYPSDLESGSGRTYSDLGTGSGRTYSDLGTGSGWTYSDLE